MRLFLLEVMMKLIIAGGRQYIPREHHIDAIDQIIKELEPEMIVHGDAPGADKLARDIADALSIPQRPMPYRSEYGAVGGRYRNVEMAEFVYPDGALIALPGGRGTAHMVETATRYNLKVFDLRKLNGSIG